VKGPARRDVSAHSTLSGYDTKTCRMRTRTPEKQLADGGGGESWKQREADREPAE
jgi:hypothetical protein